MRFSTSSFLSFKPVGGTDQWLKICSILVQFLRSYSKFRLKKTDSRGMILITQGVKKNFILGLWRKNEKCSPLIVDYDSTFIFVTLFL